MAEREYDETQTLVITDYVKTWLPTYCDYCGRTWFADVDDDGMTLAYLLDGTPRDIGRSFGARGVMSWADVVVAVYEEFHLVLRPEDGQFIDGQIERAVRHQTQVTAIRERQS